MSTTSIQVNEVTKQKLESKKIHHRESYDSVINRLLQDEEIPSIEEMFKECDALKQKKIYSTKEVVDLIHGLRGKK